MRKLLAFYNPSNGVNVRHYLAKLPRFTTLVILTLILLAFIAYTQPQLIGNDIHAISRLSLGALLGFWVDSIALPYARPDGYLIALDWRKVAKREGAADFPVAQGYELVFALSCIRRLLSMGIGMWAMGMAG